MPPLDDDDKFQPDADLSFFAQDGRGRAPYTACAVEALEPLAVMWHAGTGKHGGANSKQFPHAQRLEGGHTPTPNYENEA